MSKCKCSDPNSMHDEGCPAVTQVIEQVTFPVRFKLYKCSDCGYEKQIDTNHFGECYSFGSYNRCPKCWDLSKCTTWVCQEKPPKGAGVPKPWGKKYLGELLK